MNIAIVNKGTDVDRLLERLGIQVIAEIEPAPDPVYGHVFAWPVEVEQFLDDLDAGEK